MRPLLPLLLLSLLAADGAWADDETLAQAEEAIGAAEFEKSLKILDGKLRRAGVGREEQEVELARIQMLRAEALYGLNRETAAREALRKALELDPEPLVDPSRASPTFLAFVEKARGDVQGELTVTTDRDGAQIHIDGKPFGPSPLRTKLAVGHHEIEARAGAAVGAASVLVRASAPTSVVLALIEPRADAALVAEAPEVVEAGGGVARWVPGAAGLVLAGAGSYLLLQARDDLRVLDTAAGIDVTEAQGIRERGQRNQAIGFGALALGGAGLLTSAVLLSLSDAPPSGAKVSVLPTTEGFHLTIAGAWR